MDDAAAISQPARRRSRRWVWRGSLAVAAVVLAGVGAVAGIHRHRAYQSANIDAVLRAVAQGDAAVLRSVLAIRPELAGDATTGRTPLHEAVRANRPEMAAILLAAKADPNARDRDGSPPLEQAVSDGNLAMVKLLLDHGADANAEGKAGQSPLVRAVQDGRADVVELLLLERRADANGPAKASGRGLPLGLAVKAGRADIVQDLLDHGANPDAAGAGDPPPVVLAVQAGRADILRALLAGKASPNARGPDGALVVERAWPAESAETLLALLNYGADADPGYLAAPLGLLIDKGQGAAVGAYLKGYRGLGRRSTSDGGTLLHAAVGRNDLPLVQMLLAEGVDVNAQDGRGWTALDVAASRGDANLGVLRLLLAAKADAEPANLYKALSLALSAGQRDLVNAYLAGLANINGTRDAKGNGLLHYAAMDGDKPLVELLLANNASLTIRDWAGLYPLHVAVTAPHGAAEVAAVLLAHSEKADPNVRDLFERTPLYLAARDGADPAVLKVLLDARAKVDARGDRGETPLLLAAGRGDLANVKLLLSFKADPNVQDAQGQTPLHYAAVKGDKELARIMLDAGAGTKIRDNSRNLARICATQAGHPEISELILRVEAARAEAHKEPTTKPATKPQD